MTITRLKLGDYLVDNRFLFERKTVTDLIVSIMQGRLFRQALGLGRTSLRSAMILEGVGRNLAGSGMRWEAIQGALVTVTFFCGVPLLRARTPEETVSTMLIAAKQGQKYVTGALPRAGWRPRGRRARQLFILQGFPYVGPERARALLARFGSIQRIVNAEPKHLRAVDGIGKRIADKLRWSVEEPALRYS